MLRHHASVENDTKRVHVRCAVDDASYFLGDPSWAQDV